MFELVISKADGSLYWKEFFNSQAEASKWIAVEQTRPYWKSTYTYTVIDHTPAPPTQDELDAISTRKAQILALKQRLKTMAQQTDFTAADIKEFLMKVGKLLFLESDFD